MSVGGIFKGKGEKIVLNLLDHEKPRLLVHVYMTKIPSIIPYTVKERHG